MKRFDVITGLDVCVDLIMRGNVDPEFGQVEKLVDDYTMEMGGSASIFASQCARLGMRVAGIGVRGEDAFGAFYTEKLARCGVDGGYLSVDSRAKTGLGLCLAKGEDRAILTYSGTIDALTAADFSDERLSSARHLHIASYFLLKRLRASWPGILRRAKALGLTVSLDTNWDPDGRWEGLEELLPYVDIFLPNEREAEALGGAERLSRLAPVLSVKRGARGAELWAGGARHAALAYEARFVDAVGAGDSFDGGFVSAYLSGHSLRECLEIGCACGSHSVTASGGIAGQANRAELDALLARRGLAW